MALSKNRTDPNHITLTPMRYALYARSACHDAGNPAGDTLMQVAVLRDTAKQCGFRAAVEIVEHAGAAASGSRPGFSRLLTLLGEYEVDALLVVRLDRLARNPREMATLVRMLQDGTLKEIVTPDRIYRDGEAVFDLFRPLGQGVH